MSGDYSQSSDDDRTDELPTLASTATLRRSAPPAVADRAWSEDTGEYTVAFAAPALEPNPPPAAIAALTAEVERWSARCAAAERRLAENALLVADLDAAMAAARRSLEDRNREAEALSAALDERNRALTAALTETARLRDALASAETPGREPKAAPVSHPSAAESQRLLEDYAALAAYVNQRRQWWERAQREIATLATKAAALEHELAERDRRLARAEALATREAARASDLRAQAIEAARQARDLQHAALRGPASRDADTPSPTATALRAEREEVEARLANEVAARARLEAALAEKDRELAARDERLSALQRELDQRLESFEKLSAMDLSLQGLKAKISGRLTTPPDEPAPAAPALVCITGDAPQRVLLGPSTTFGRGAHCDVQILTHYVSREHARIVSTKDGVHIEDLGSRNGVFVNATKVARRRLRQGDLIKIGETQFRFVESMAH